MYKYEDIKVVHLEITEKCQAACAMCARNHSTVDGLLHHLSGSELSLEDCRQIFDKDFVRQLNQMYMCGNFGDPIIAQDTLEVFEYFRYTNPSIKLNMYTNGGARPAEWWRDLASVLYKGRVIFSVDGLEDTNHIYRENVQWDRVMSSMKAFIGAGGEAEWHFLVFKHNEHQVDEAREFARSLGFKSFVPKRTSRWGGGDYKHLAPPEKKEYVHQIKTFKVDMERIYGSYKNFLNETKISCRVKSENSLYVSAEGLVLPCCWLGGSALYEDDIATYQESDLFQYLNGDKDNINAKINGLKGVFDSGFFHKIEKSWSCSSTTNGRLKTCAKTCSVDHDNFREQFVKNYSL